MEDGYVTFSCLIGVPESRTGSPTVLAHEGGVAYDEDQLGLELYEYNASADDAFNEDFGALGNGLHVWSGEIKPVYDDMPIYRNTKARKATVEDVKHFLKMS